MSYSCFEMLTRSDTTSTHASGVHRSNTKSSSRTDIVALVRKALYSVNTDDYVEDALARLGRFSQWTLKRKSTLMSRYRGEEEEDEEDPPDTPQSPVYFNGDNHYPTTGLPYSRYYCHTLYESETSLTSSVSDPLLYSSQPSTRSLSTKQHMKASSVTVRFPPALPQSSTTALSMSISFPASATTRSIPATRSFASMATPYNKHLYSMPPSSTLRSLASKRTTLGSLCEEAVLGKRHTDALIDIYEQRMVGSSPPCFVRR
ncbi:hypothetical protein CYLTODRAFT_449803 [Cylindrobasidium torrendii FP15055 ss-10]|uniref:Uncharacterized protein n=1 Tax=Cylindrobasidium torrendii FP15055 ss-10 TaxID=1314674 RepID=A0A0D7BS58_9AGAR|nr:hypothetical protein CYLTODRAFT_449803 [Cylindrobasidium torrendii FP15055 ss-10]